MLRRRSIHTKLIYALVVLTLIFCALFASAFWGLRRYHALAESVSQQAVEIPHAYTLIRCSESIHKSYTRLGNLREKEGMIEAFSRSEVEIENSSIDTNLEVFNLTLGLYEDATEQSSDDVRLLVDRLRQRESLAGIREAKDAVDQLWGAPEMMTHNGDKQFLKVASILVERSHTHIELIHSEMKAFSADAQGQYTGLIWFNWFCVGLAVALLLLLWFSFKSLVSKPFRTLLDGSKLVAAGQYGHRIDLGTSDELSELAGAMNSMSTRFRDVYDRQKTMNEDLDRQVKARTREVIQNEQLASVGFLAAGVAHEINNPLATIAWSSEALQTGLEDLSYADDSLVLTPKFSRSLSKNLRRIEEEAYRCKGITERLLDFSRLGDVSRSQSNIGDLVKEVVSMVSKVGKYKCKTLRVHCEENVMAHLNSHEMRQVVLNLITNALESVSSDGAVDVYVQDRDDYAYVGVFDDGCGMSQEVLNHLFEPFFTRRRDGTGTGLGLSITYRIVSQHHGSLAASSDGEGQGSRMEMLLPVSAVLDDTAEHNQTLSGWNHETRKAA